MSKHGFGWYDATIGGYQTITSISPYGGVTNAYQLNALIDSATYAGSQTLWLYCNSTWYAAPNAVWVHG